MVKHLFVYGTLRRDANNELYHVLARHAEFVGDGVFQGRLFDLGDYPGAVPSNNPSDQVRGEVYALRNADRVLPVLDEYEGCNATDRTPTEFRRDAVDIHLDTKQKIRAYVYVFNRSTDRLPRIRSGDFFRKNARRNQKGGRQPSRIRRVQS